MIAEGGELCGLKDLPQHRPFSPAESFMIRSEQQNKMKFPLFAAILFSIGWMSAVVAVHDGPALSCCLSVSKTKIPVEDIKNYSMQAAPPCPIRAVRFHTMKDKTICSDPNDSWTKKAINHVDKMNSQKHLKEPIRCYTSATNLIPTRTSINKRPGTETETSTSTPVRTTTTIKTARLETVFSKTAIQPASVTKENQESTTIRCGTGEKTAPPAETTRTRVTKATKKLPKMMRRKKGKSKKGLRKFQMRYAHT